MKFLSFILSALLITTAHAQNSSERTPVRPLPWQNNPEAQTPSTQETPEEEPQFVGQPTLVTAETLDASETVIIARRIYQCRNGNTFVFADDENKHKYNHCQIIREQQTAQIPKTTNEPAIIPADTCSGMIKFRGNTYLFDENKPCPIPADFFGMLTPLEANSTYYTNPESNSQ